MKKDYKISNMHCSACALNIEKHVSTIQGIDEVTVNTATNKMYVQYSKDVNKEIIQTVENLGFGIEENEVHKTKTVLIKGMHCASCSAAVEKNVSKIKGIENAFVNLTTNLLSYQGIMSASIDAQVEQCITSLGFEVIKEKTNEQVEYLTQLKTCKQVTILAGILFIIAMTPMIKGMDKIINIMNYAGQFQVLCKPKNSDV